MTIARVGVGPGHPGHGAFDAVGYAPCMPHRPRRSILRVLIVPALLAIAVLLFLEQ